MNATIEKVLWKEWHALFEGEKQLTKWYRSKDKPHSIGVRMMRRDRRRNLSVHTKRFMEKKPA